MARRSKRRKSYNDIEDDYVFTDILNDYDRYLSRRVYREFDSLPRKRRDRYPIPQRLYDQYRTLSQPVREYRKALYKYSPYHRVRAEFNRATYRANPIARSKCAVAKQVRKHLAIRKYKQGRKLNKGGAGAGRRHKC